MGLTESSTRSSRDSLPQDEALRLLTEAPLAHIGFISDGVPYVTPISFVVDHKRLLFRTQAGDRLDSLRRDPKVCIEISRFDTESGDWACVIVFGTATEVDDQGTRQLAVEMLYKKYADALGDPLTPGGLQPVPGHPHVIAVTIDEITGMSSGRESTPPTPQGQN